MSHTLITLFSVLNVITWRAAKRRSPSIETKFTKQDLKLQHTLTGKRWTDSRMEPTVSPRVDGAARTSAPGNSYKGTSLIKYAEAESRRKPQHRQRLSLPWMFLPQDALLFATKAV